MKSITSASGARSTYGDRAARAAAVARPERCRETARPGHLVMPRSHARTPPAKRVSTEMRLSNETFVNVESALQS